MGIAQRTGFGHAAGRFVAGLLAGIGLGGLLVSSAAAARGRIGWPALTLYSPGDAMDVSGTVTLWAATDAEGLTSLQFQVDGRDVGPLISAGACQAAFDTKTVTDGPHVIQAMGLDEFGNTVQSRPNVVFVNNLLPAVSGLTATAVSTSSATLAWTTALPGYSWLEYGPTAAYGSVAPRVETLSESHTQTLTGLLAETTYHARAWTVTENGTLGLSGDFVFTTLRGCLTPDPFVAFGGGNCVDGGWRFPDRPAPPPPSPTPSVTPTPTALPGGCAPPDPFAAFGGGVCVNGGWRFPDLTAPTPTPTPTPSPTPTPIPTPPGGCALPDPFTAFGGGVCVNGGWRFPTFPPSPSPTATPTPSPTPPGGCLTPDPFVALGGGTCFNGGWWPPGMIVPQPKPTPTITPPPPATGVPARTAADCVHAVIFAEAAAAVRRSVDPAHVPVGARPSGAYSRMIAPAREAVAIWTARAEGRPRSM